MDRRTALTKLATTGIAAAVGTSIVSSPAFAAGGSEHSLPTMTGGTIRFGASNISKNDKRVFVVNIGNLATGSCTSGAPVRQYRWDDSLGGSTPWTVLAGAPNSYDVFGRTSGWSEIVTFSIRWLCPTPAGWAYSCQGFRFTVTARPGGGRVGSVSLSPAIVTASPAAALNCDAAPFPPLP